MAGRLAWVLAGGAAIVGGMAIQDGDMLSFDRDDSHIDREVDAAVDEATIERQGRSRIVIDGRSEIDEETVRQMTEAVADLVKAEAALAAAQVGADDDPEELAGARAQRDEARARVDRLKAAMHARDGSAEARAAIREQVRSEVREAVRNK